MMISEKYGEVIGFICFNGMICWLVMVVCLMYSVWCLRLSLISMWWILLKLWLSFIIIVVLVFVRCWCNFFLGSILESIERFWLWYISGVLSIVVLLSIE